MKPGMELPQIKEENQEKRFLLGTGVKFCQHYFGICLQNLRILKYFAANKHFLLMRIPREWFGKNSKQMGDKTLL